MTLGDIMNKAICLGVALSGYLSSQAGTTCRVHGQTIPTALTSQGAVQGFLDASGNSVFLGIPFAATTGGNNRWKAPQDPLKSLSFFNATKYGPTCPQAISGDLYTQQGEDCLNLNIWAPPSGSKLPVFVYMYGGAMVTGSNSNPLIQGNNFARKNVIYVNFNTRESIFASPYSSELNGSQNFGILDVDKALQWVRDNIQGFGGDPDHIVFGGHSSGAVQVDHYLWNHPGTWLKGAIQMSANAMSGPAYAPKNVALDVAAQEVGCPKGKGQLDCLRKVDIYKFQTSFFNSTSNTWFTPVIDGNTRHFDYAARFKAGKYASHVPLLAGTSDGEGTIFSLVYGGENSKFSSWINTFNADSAHIPDDLLLAAYNISDFASESLMSGTQYGDARFNCPTDYLLDMRSAKQNTWVYRFFGKYDNVIPVPGTAPTHGTEIPFFLGGNECFKNLNGVTEAQQALADSMNDWLVQWIKNPSAGPGWDKATPKSGPLVKLGVDGDELSRIKGTTGEFNAICKSVYNPNLPKYPVVQNPTSRDGPIIGIIEEYIYSTFGTNYPALQGIDMHNVAHTRKDRWADQIRNSVQSLHQSGVIWGDGKPENVLVDANDDAWLIDFGGGWTNGWVDKHLAGPIEGDIQAVENIEKFLGVGIQPNC